MRAGCCSPDRTWALADSRWQSRGARHIPNQHLLKKFFPSRDHRHECEFDNLSSVLRMQSGGAVRVHLDRQRKYRNHQAVCGADLSQQSLLGVFDFRGSACSCHLPLPRACMSGSTILGVPVCPNRAQRRGALREYERPHRKLRADARVRPRHTSPRPSTTHRGQSGFRATHVSR